MNDDMYKVEVRSNVVVKINRLKKLNQKKSVCTDDPLEVCTILAQNNKSNGCFDGDYFVCSFGAAQTFASICLSYQQSLCEKSSISLQKAGDDGNFCWVNPFIPNPKHLSK